MTYEIDIYTYIYIDRGEHRLTSVGLAHARPNKSTQDRDTVGCDTVGSV